MCSKDVPSNWVIIIISAFILVDCSMSQYYKNEKSIREFECQQSQNKYTP